MAHLDSLHYRHDELRRAIDIQRETVDVLRSRANLILVTTLAVSAFLGTDAATNAGTAGVIVGIVALGATVALFAAVVWPRDWSWYNQPAQLADETYNDPRLTEEPFLVAGIDGMGRSSAYNEAEIAKVSRLIVYEIAAAGITAAVWLVLTIP